MIVNPITGFAGDRSSILRQEVPFFPFLRSLYFLTVLERTYEFFSLETDGNERSHYYIF